MENWGYEISITYAGSFSAELLVSVLQGRPGWGSRADCRGPPSPCRAGRVLDVAIVEWHS